MNKMFNQKNLLSLGIGFGVAYYFLVIKPKNDQAKEVAEARKIRKDIIYANPNIPMPEYIEQELPEDFDLTDIEGIITL